MKAKPAILVIDQGTSSTRSIVFDENAQVVCTFQQEFDQFYPRNGWVEHDPETIWQTARETLNAAYQVAVDAGHEVASIGITNQRETVVVWDRESGRPVYNAIVWQDRRTSGGCETLKSKDLESDIYFRTGLFVDPYFSALKIAWILDNVEGARKQAENGRLICGTIDSFLLYRLTGGNEHKTDVTNASRTSLFNLTTMSWDETLCEYFGVPFGMLPTVCDCIADFGKTSSGILGREIPITGIAGDQQAASIGQGCRQENDMKATFGTGGFVLANTGSKIVRSSHRLLTTVASRIDGHPQFALEGSIFVAGAAVQWLRDGLGVISSASQCEELVNRASSNTDVYMVPAFTGLGAPWWNPHARAAIFGLTRSVTSADLVRAALESVVYQTHDLVSAIIADGFTPEEIKVDGGMSSNSWFLQHLANVLGLDIQRPRNLETTALGAAFLAGVGAGVWPDLEQIMARKSLDKVFSPHMDEAHRTAILQKWHNAVQATLSV